VSVVLASWAILTAAATVALPDNWPGWRGPHHTGESRETNLPTTWGEGKNIAWRLPLPGMAGSTPAVWGDKIFVTSADGADLVLVCVSTAGKELWRRKVGKVGRAIIKGDEANEASNSPSTDGKYVWTLCGAGDLVCFDFDGNEKWRFNIQERYGKWQIQHGIHGTPLLYEGRLYLSMMHAKGHWVIALDAADGKEKWKVDRKTDAQGESKEAYTSPCLWTNGKDAYIVVSGADYATAHRLEDGGEIWRLGDLNPKSSYSPALRVIASPVAGPDLVVVPTARGGLISAVKADAKGMMRAGDAAELWRKAKGAPDVSTPAYHDGLIYLCDGGVLLCWDAKTGKEQYKERIHNSRYRASPVIADGKVYLTARDGTFTVVQAGPKFAVLATNTLNDSFTASPAIANGRIYVRGYKALYAIGDAGK
jgi:outer membrane protein assembly factor BamB